MPSQKQEKPSASSVRMSLPLGIPGDSGAWVIDRRSGCLAGHVLAWSERKQVAYICPMDVLLRDIAETLEAAEVRLPGGEVIVRLLTNDGVSAISAEAVAASRRPGSDVFNTREGDTIGEDFSELDSLTGRDEEEKEKYGEEGIPELQKQLQRQQPTTSRLSAASTELNKSPPPPPPSRRDEHYDASVRALKADMEKVRIPGGKIGVGLRQ